MFRLPRPRRFPRSSPPAWAIVQCATDPTTAVTATAVLLSSGVVDHVVLAVAPWLDAEQVAASAPDGAEVVALPPGLDAVEQADVLLVDRVAATWVLLVRDTECPTPALIDALSAATGRRDLTHLRTPSSAGGWCARAWRTGLPVVELPGTPGSEPSAVGPCLHVPAAFGPAPPVPAPLRATPPAPLTRLSLKDVRGRRTDLPWPAEAYRATLSVASADCDFAAFTGRTIRTTIRNDGTHPFPGQGQPGPAIAVSYRWRAPDGTLLVSEGRRTGLPGPLAPGQSGIVLTGIDAPAPGRYLLEVDLVHEHVRWFDTAVTAAVEVAG